MHSKKTVLKKSDIIYHLLKGWRIILLFTVLGFMLGVVAIGAGYIRGEMAKEYKITSSVVVVALNEKDQFSSKTNVPYKTDVDIARDIAEDAKYIIKSQNYKINKSRKCRQQIPNTFNINIRYNNKIK